MPVYNNAHYLPEAIQSIRNQTYPDFEFIIVDDCSTDETPAILSHFAQKDDRIFILRNNRNLGRAGARNQLLKAKPSGEFIAIMDSDDISLPERFEKQISFLDAHSEVVAVGAQVRNVDEQNSPTPEQTHLPETHGRLVWTMLYIVPLCNPVVMMRANAVWQLDGYQEGSAVEDAEFWSRLVYTGRFANLPEILLHYRMPSERLVLRMTDWAIPLLKVTHSFVENLIDKPIETKMCKHLYHSMFYNPDYHLTSEETLHTIFLLQDVFEAMQTKGLLQGDDIPEVIELMLNQFRTLLSYTSDSVNY